MTIGVKIVKGTKYLYFTFYDSIEKKKKEEYIGPADDPRAQEKAKQLERHSIRREISKLKSQLREYEQPTENLVKRRVPRAANHLYPHTSDILRILKESPIYEPKIYYKSSEHMSEVEDNSIQLVVTSPPYNVAKDYGVYNDKKEKEEYLELLNRVWTECKRKLCKGGRIAVNVADTWRQPYIPLHADITQQLLDLGLLMRGLIYWDKGASVGVSTAWGSFRMASNPTLRDVGEHILIFCKDDYQLESKNSISTITPEQFTAYTQSVWKFSTADPKKEGHPAPFPDELPKRLIQLYTFLGDTVLDPFLGSGTTCKVAKAWGRKSIGYELDEGYKPTIDQKISSVKDLSIPLDSFTRNGKGKNYLDDYERVMEDIRV